MLSETIRRRMLEATKAGRAVEKNLLRVALGEVQTAASRSASALSDKEVVAVLRKLVKSNEESLAAATRPETRATLEEELQVLALLLPRTLDVAGIVAALAPVLDQIRAAAGDGAATGLAVKHLEAAGQAVEGRDVAAAVKRIRS